MALYIVEREHAERMQLQALGLTSSETSQVDERIQWLFSFLSADQHKTYCLFEAPSAEVLYAAADDADLPPSAIIPVERIDPEHLASLSDDVGAPPTP